MSLDADQLKMAAAQSAVAQVKGGMVVGLGSGSTAKLAVDAIGRLVRDGLRIVGISTSENTTAQAKALGIPLATLADEPSIDLTIDGADEVQERSLDLIKGRGGALLREKIVASASRRLVIMVHDTKIVRQLAEHDPIPVEIVPFGWQSTVRTLVELGAKPELRKNPGGEPFVSDGGHYIFDCSFAPVSAAGELASQLDHVVGVVEHGLFIGMASEVHVAGPGGVRILKAERE